MKNMKKILLLIAVLGLFSTGVAQFTYGPKLGVNMAKFSGDRMLPGGQAGLFVNGELWDRIGVQVDFLWTLKGSKNVKENQVYTVTQNTLTGNFDSTLSTNTTTHTSYYRFVDIPICAYFPISEHIRGFFGPQLSIFRGGHEKYVYSGKTTENDITGVTGQMSWIGGFDLKSNSPIIFGVRFVSNKFGIGTKQSGAGDDNTKSLNAFMINLGYRMSW